VLLPGLCRAGGGARRSTSADCADGRSFGDGRAIRYALAGRHARAYGHDLVPADPHADACDHQAADRETDRHSTADRYACSADCDRIGHICSADCDGAAERHAYPYADTDAYFYANSDGATAHVHLYADTDTDADAYFHADTDGDNTAAYADSHANGHDGCADADIDADDDGDRDTGDAVIKGDVLPMDLSALLKRLTEAHGIAGYEAPVREIVREEFARYSHEVRVTKMGSVVGVRNGSGPAPRRKVMLCAHMDEIGLMVTGVDQGFLRVAKVAGSDARVMLGQEVVVHGQRELPGVVGSRPPHLLPPSERDQVVPFDQLFVDVGLPEAQVKRLVRVGDLISIRREACELKGGLFSGKALDDRASVAAVAVCLETLGSLQHKWDVMGVASVQEETTFLGAATSAYSLHPDVAIAIDVTFGEQSDVSKPHAMDMGKGPAIGIGPNLHPELVKALVDTAGKLEMPYQMDPLPGASGTDAWPIQVAREGIPTALLSIPLRYMHTPVETVALKDIERTGKLMAEFIAHLDDEFVKTLTFAID